MKTLENMNDIEWHFNIRNTKPILEIRHAHHNMLRRRRCKRMERTYLRLKKSEDNDEI